MIFSNKTDLDIADFRNMQRNFNRNNLNGLQKITVFWLGSLIRDRVMGYYQLQEPVKTNCPYCGELIELLVDCSVPRQNYIEDCQVCCSPIEVVATVDEKGKPSVITTVDND